MLLKGIIEEAPILLLFVCFAVAVVVAVYGRKIILRAIERLCSRKTRAVVFIVITTLLVPVCVRGNLGTFPLRAEDIYVSSSAAVNDCVPNGIFMLKKAWSEKKKQFKLETEQSILNNEHFSSADEALDVLRALDADILNGELQDVMFVRTPADVVAKDYNVVLIIVESWSNLLIDYEKPLDADLLCGLRKHFDADYLFRNFVSATNGTIDAVETFTINAQHPRIFTSSYRTYQYPTATAKVWHDAGYETSFLSGIEISWRNLMEVLPKQNFDRVIGKYELLNERPEAECNTTWGVYDHELLSYLNDYINTGGAPKFVMALTSTSHTPFEFPTSFALPEITTDKLSSDNFATSEDVTLDTRIWPSRGSWTTLKLRMQPTAPSLSSRAITTSDRYSHIATKNHGRSTPSRSISTCPSNYVIESLTTLRDTAVTTTSSRHSQRSPYPTEHTSTRVTTSWTPLKHTRGTVSTEKSSLHPQRPTKHR